MLNQMEASKLIANSHQLVVECPGYRFGQALWNQLPQDLRDEYLATDKDFFYSNDNKFVMETFFQYFVDKE